MQVKIVQKRGERGQSFMELAISIVFLLTLVAALIDLGWAFYTMTALRDAAQEAALYGSMCAIHYDSASGLNVLNKSVVLERLQQSTSAPLNMNDVVVDPANPGDPQNQVRVCVIDPANPPDSCDPDPGLEPQLGYSLRVEAWVNHQIRTPFVGAFIGRYTYPLRVDVSDVILRVVDTNCQ